MNDETELARLLEESRYARGLYWVERQKAIFERQTTVRVSNLLYQVAPGGRTRSLQKRTPVWKLGEPTDCGLVRNSDDRLVEVCALTDHVGDSQEQMWQRVTARETDCRKA